MANRTRVLDTLEAYFKTKGRILKVNEYSRETDTPMRHQQIRKIFGGWNNMERLLMARERNQDTDANDVIARRNRALYEQHKAWVEASENLDAKAQREAEAQAVAEKLAANAATPEGANANKIAIGGPLPAEQPDYTRMGATVNTDPVTLEQTVVDTAPEKVVVEGGEESGRTPAELVEAAKEELKEGAVKTGHATDGGSQGTASVATAAALDNKKAAK